MTSRSLRVPRTRLYHYENYAAVCSYSPFVFSVINDRIYLDGVAKPARQIFGGVI